MVKNYKIIVSYDGTRYNGWQKQKNVESTIQGKLEALLTRLAGKTAEQRNAVIEALAEQGIATNVHYKPLPMMTAYKTLGFDIKDYSNAYAQYANEVTLPLYSTLTEEDGERVCAALKAAL